MNRDAIAEALLDLLIKTQRFKKVDRNLVTWDQAPEQPALYFGEQRESTTRSAPLAPPVRAIHIELFVYARTDAKPNEPRATVLNTLLDAIDTALTPAGADLVNRRQTLGGLVTHAYVEGDTLKDPGYLDGQAVAVVPIKIIVP